MYSDETRWIERFFSLEFGHGDTTQRSGGVHMPIITTPFIVGGESGDGSKLHMDHCFDTRRDEQGTRTQPEGLTRATSLP